MSNRTQKEIIQEIKALEAKVSDIEDVRKNRPEIVELETRIRDIKNKYREETQTTVECCKSDIQALKKELENKREDNKLQLSERVEKWFRNYISNIGWGYKKPKIFWISDDERFIIVTNPGGTAGIGTAMGTGGYYQAPSEHWITETVEGTTYIGYGHSVRATKWMTHEGRLTKEVKQKMIAYTEELRDKKP